MQYRVGFLPKTGNWPNSVNQTELVNTTENYQVIDLSKDTLIWRTDQPIGDFHSGLVYKLYYSRGPISWIRFHLTKFRVEREFAALFYLQHKQVPACRPVAWTKGRCSKLGNRYEVLE